VSVETRDLDTSVLVFEVKVRDRRHLARIVRIIRTMPDVLRVTRTIAAHARDYHRKLNNDEPPGRHSK
jgi:hypothetical protein